MRLVFLLPIVAMVAAQSLPPRLSSVSTSLPSSGRRLQSAPPSLPPPHSTFLAFEHLQEEVYTGSLDCDRGTIRETATAANLPTGTDPYIVSVEFKTGTSGTMTLWSWGDGGTANTISAFILKSNFIRHYWWGEDLSYDFVYGDGNWHTVVASWDGVTRSIDLDGTTVATDTPSGTHANRNDNFCLGGEGGQSRNSFYGSLRNLRIFTPPPAPSAPPSHPPPVDFRIQTIPMNPDTVADRNVTVFAGVAYAFNFTGSTVAVSGDQFLFVPEGTGCNSPPTVPPLLPPPFSPSPSPPGSSYQLVGAGSCKLYIDGESRATWNTDIHAFGVRYYPMKFTIVASTYASTYTFDQLWTFLNNLSCTNLPQDWSFHAQDNGNCDNAVADPRPIIGFSLYRNWAANNPNSVGGNLLKSYNSNMNFTSSGTGDECYKAL